MLSFDNISQTTSKTVMEGKAVMFKKFAAIDVCDIEIDASEIDQIVGTIATLKPIFSGINLKHIKVPEFSEIEARPQD